MSGQRVRVLVEDEPDLRARDDDVRRVGRGLHGTHKPAIYGKPSLVLAAETN